MKVVVVGGGILGMSSAYELLKDGHEVVLLESDRLGAAATHGNAAKIALGECQPVPAPGVIAQGLKWMLEEDSPLAIHPQLSFRYVKFLLGIAKACNRSTYREGIDLHLSMAEDAKEILDEYKREGLEFEQHDNGLVIAFEDEQILDEHCKTLDIFEGHGLRGTKLRGSEVQEVEPALAERVKFGLYFTEDRQLDPDTLTEALRGAISGKGGEIREGVTVTGFKKDNNTVVAVLTSAGAIDCDAVVLAPGVALAELSAKLGQRLPVFSGKGYSLDYDPAPVDLKVSLTLADAHLAITQLDGFVRIAGTMEFGAKDNSLNPVRIDALRKAARLYLKDWPADTTAEVRQWAGQRPMTADGVPIVGRLEKIPNAYIAGGHGMLGLTLGPGTAKIIADLIGGRTPRLSQRQMDMISPNRFKAFI